MACYRSENCPLDFSYHDSEWKLIVAADGEATLGVKRLNLCADAPQNPFDTDMELKDARVFLRGFRAVRDTYYDLVPESGSAELRTESGELTGAEAEARLWADAQFGLCLKSLEPLGENRFALAGTGEVQFFEAEVCCDALAVEWEDYVGPAWYEKRREAESN